MMEGLAALFLLCCPSIGCGVAAALTRSGRATVKTTAVLSGLISGIIVGPGTALGAAMAGLLFPLALLIGAATAILVGAATFGVPYVLTRALMGKRAGV